MLRVILCRVTRSDATLLSTGAIWRLGAANPKTWTDAAAWFPTAAETVARPRRGDVPSWCRQRHASERPGRRFQPHAAVR